MKIKREISIGAMALFTEELKKDNPKKAFDWFEKNVNDFKRKELIAIIKELLQAVKVYNIKDLITDVAYELDDLYDDLYQGI